MVDVELDDEDSQVVSFVAEVYTYIIQIFALYYTKNAVHSPTNIVCSCCLPYLNPG